MSVRSDVEVKEFWGRYHWRVSADGRVVGQGSAGTFEVAYVEAEQVQGMVVAESDGGLTDEFWDQIEAQRVKLRGLDGKPLYAPIGPSSVRVQVRSVADFRCWRYRLVVEDGHVVQHGTAVETSRDECVERGQQALNRYRAASQDGWEEA